MNTTAQELAMSAWGDLMRTYGGNYTKAAAAWRGNGWGDPPCGRGQQEAQTEKSLMWEIIESLRALGWLCFHFDAGSLEQTNRAKAGRPPPGWPDLACYGPGGRHLLLEVKTATGRVSEAQTAMHNHLRDRGHSVAVVKSVEQALAVVEGATNG